MSELFTKCYADGCKSGEVETGIGMMNCDNCKGEGYVEVKTVMDKEYAGFESLGDMIEDMSESGGALFSGMGDIGGEYQGTLRIVATYTEEE